MRQSRQATAESRARIVNAASQLFRKQGLEATGVADIMQAAGLTHGGFYRHFPSKDALAAEAVAAAFAERTRVLSPDGTPPDAGALKAYVERYLSDGHLAHPETGCPMAALASEAAHAPAETQAAFAEGGEGLIDLIARASSDDALADEAGRARALRLMASLVGAVAIARAVGASKMAGEVLSAVLDDPEVRPLLDVACTKPVLI